MNELKPCKCGGEACLSQCIYEYHRRFGVVCLNCGCETRQFFETKQKAIEAWNRRA